MPQRFTKRPGFEREAANSIDDTVVVDSLGNASATTSVDETSRSAIRDDSMAETLEEIKELLILQNELIKGLY